jgi:hypothetical protein
VRSKTPSKWQLKIAERLKTTTDHRQVTCCLLPTQHDSIDVQFSNFTFLTTRCLGDAQLYPFAIVRAREVGEFECERSTVPSPCIGNYMSTYVMYILCETGYGLDTQQISSCWTFGYVFYEQSIPIRANQNRKNNSKLTQSTTSSSSGTRLFVHCKSAEVIPLHNLVSAEILIFLSVSSLHQSPFLLLAFSRTHWWEVLLVPSVRVPSQPRAISSSLQREHF